MVHVLYPSSTRYDATCRKKCVEAEPLISSGYKGIKQHEANIRYRYDVLPEKITNPVQFYQATSTPEKVAEYNVKLSEFAKSSIQKQSILK
jgi:hypothetical protein